jgi:uncharacterized cupin superfamily protein
LADSSSLARVPNVFDSEWEFEHGGVGMASLTKPGGAELLGATVYELEPGSRWADLHLHYANEELILVLTGTPTLHMLSGSRELATGEAVVCRRGRSGAHRLENASSEPARVVIVSTMLMPDVVDYPERGHVFVMSEPPYTDGLHDPQEHGRLLRVFERDRARPVPPDG